jgi:molecular chaperone IbpA
MTRKFPSLWNTEQFDRYFIGSDQLAKTIQQTADLVANTAFANFPPYNIRKESDNKYVIELAVAGFGKQDIEMTLEQNKLTIKGNTKADNTNSYIFKGIADRGFTRNFTIADNVEIENAQLINGMLSIWLEHIVPEAQKAKKIEITDPQEETSTKKNKKQFLSE